jgi:glycosyltransferase involved in cell wall biosynthesis
VYALVFSGETLAFAAWASERMRCPLVVHVADDGLETQKAGVTREIRSILESAARRLTISEEMRAEFASRYDVTSDVLHNGASEALFADVRRPDDRDGTFVVRYLGSVVPGHHDHAIEDIAEAVRALAASGLAIRFELCGARWTSEHAERLADGVTVVYRGEISKAAGVDLLKSASLLVVPVSFDPARFTHVRLSLPTKLTECLASATPTLVYGPRGSAPVEFCRRHGVGTILDERAPAKLEALMRRLAAAPAEARNAGEHDRDFIRRRYSATLAREQFRTIISGAVHH